MNLDPRKLLSIPAVYRSFQDLIRPPNALENFANTFLKVGPHHRILDVGCGPCALLPYMSGADYIGVDISPEYVAAAQIKHGDKGKFFVKAVTADTTFSGMGTFDLVVAIGLLHHLDDAEASSFFKAAKAVLNPEGRIVTLDNVFVPEQSFMARTLIKMDRGEHVRGREGYVSLAKQHMANVDAVIAHDLLRIPYTLIILSCH